MSNSQQMDKAGQDAAAEGGRHYYVPSYSVRLVRDSFVKTETTLADTPERVAAIVRAYWGEGELDREHLVCLVLNARSQVVAVSELCCQSPSPRFGPSEVFA